MNKHNIINQAISYTNCVLIIVIIIIIFKRKSIEGFNNKYTINYYKPIVFNPNHKNALVTLYTPNISDYAKYSIKNMKYYALKHNLTLYIFDKALSNNIEHGCWNKIPAILYLLNNTSHNYVIWMDIDAVFNKINKSFNYYINKYPTKDLIVCRDIRDKHLKFNSGVMIIKNTKWSKYILNKTWNKPIKHGYGGHGDQVIIKNTIIEDNSYNRVELLPEREFNSFPRKNITDNDFIIHFMGHNTKDRIKNISDINKKLNI